MTTVHETEVLDFVAHILYTTALFICRLSGLAFYYRLSARSSKLHLAIIVAVPLLLAAYLPQFFLLLFHCRPVTGLWPYGWQHETTDYKCLSWGLVYSVNSGVSLACDVLMFIIPAILIKQLHISREKKIKLSLVMFPGVLFVHPCVLFHSIFPRRKLIRSTQCHRHLRYPRLARGYRPMGLRRQLGLQSYARYRKCRDRRHAHRAISASSQTRVRECILPINRVHVQPYALAVCAVERPLETYECRRVEYP
jgi:hypothetical protein